ncbi:MAG: diguanylate cyclase [Coriobacteriia bacterium]|nr:diguanylate cyclase [Coriobacteriia bacterium]
MSSVPHPGVADAEPVGTSASDPAERRARVDALNSRARALRRVDYRQLVALAEEAFELAQQRDAIGERYHFGMATALALLADSNVTHGEWEDAFAQTAQALALLEGENPTEVLADVYGTIGWSHFCMGDYAEALDRLADALAIAEEIDDVNLQAYMLDRFGSVHAACGHDDVAIEHQRRSLELHRAHGDDTGEALALNNMTYTLMGTGDLEGALAAAEAALAYAQDADQPYLQVGVMDTVAEVHLRLGDLDGTEHYARRTVEMARELGSEPDEANGLMMLGRVLKLRGRWDEALEATEGALALADRRRLSVESFTCHQLLSEIHEQQGDLAAALAHYKRFHELKQERVNRDTNARLAQLRVESQVVRAKKDAEIQRLRTLALEREVEERRVAQARLEAQASLDALTGLFNRTHLEVLAEETRLTLASGRPVSLLMLDIDHFKSINDRHGHTAGDHVLSAASEMLRDNARASDVPCRYGGDEFLILMHGLGEDQALQAAERLREAIGSRPVPIGDAEIDVTASIGVATVHPEEPAQLQDLIERADRGLYAAKQAGRNRVVAEDGHR